MLAVYHNLDQSHLNVKYPHVASGYQYMSRYFIVFPELDTYPADWKLLLETISYPERCSFHSLPGFEFICLVTRNHPQQCFTNFNIHRLIQESCLKCSNIYYVHIQIPHKEYKHYILQMFTNKESDIFKIQVQVQFIGKKWRFCIFNTFQVVPRTYSKQQ